MTNFPYARIVVMLACHAFVPALPATAAPLAALHFLVGTWHCGYRAGAARFEYDATYALDLDGHTLRQVDSYAGGGAEELVAFDSPHGGWKAVVFDDHGDTTVMRAVGIDPNHIAYRSVYPDASVAVTFDRVSATTYTLHGTVRAAGKTTTSVDTCIRAKLGAGR